MESSARLSLPFISPGQAQKELFHNEALQILDSVIAAAVEEPPRNDPPDPPVVGTCFLVGPSPTGDWAPNANALASYTAAGWRFAAPLDGMQVWIKSSSVSAIYAAGAWQVGTLFGSKVVVGGAQVVGAQASSIADPAGGATIDSEARTAISSILAALRQHGLISSS
jgi:hypothetical protein